MRKFIQNFLFFIFLSFSLSNLSGQDVEYGMASYYGDEFNGGETASGQRYDKNELTAAHKTLAMGTKVRVTRLDNNKFVDVKINDRGPYLKGRIIDLSGKAAETLGMRSDGVAEVKVEVLGKGGQVVSTDTKKDKVTVPIVEAATASTSTDATTIKKTTTAPKETPKEAVKDTEVYTPKGEAPPKSAPIPVKETKTPPKAVVVNTKQSSSPEVSESKTEVELVTGKDFKEYGLYTIEVARPKQKGYGVQVASLTNYSNALRQVAELQGKWYKNILMSIEKGATDSETNYKIILGPFPDQASAENYKKHASKKGVKGFVVSLENLND